MSKKRAKPNWDEVVVENTTIAVDGTGVLSVSDWQREEYVNSARAYSDYTRARVQITPDQMLALSGILARRAVFLAVKRKEDQICTRAMSVMKANLLGPKGR